MVKINGRADLIQQYYERVHAACANHDRLL